MLLDRFFFAEHLAEGEELRFAIHQHWLPVFPRLFQVAFFGIGLPGILLLFLTPIWPVFVIWIFVGFVKFFYAFADHWFDAILITNHGLIDIEWNGFFHKSAQRAEYESINGVLIEQEGVFPRIFGFGRLVVVKEGEGGGEFELEFAADPAEAERQIMEAKEAFETEHGAEEEEAVHAILSRIIAKEMRRQKEEGGEHLADLL